jgi:hypothetical protein
VSPIFGTFGSICGLVGFCHVAFCTVYIVTWHGELAVDVVSV